MELGRVKDIVGFALVGLHLIAIGLCFLWLRQRMSVQSFQITVLILSPVTATYALAYVKEVVRAITKDNIEDKQKVSKRFAALAFLFVAAFSIGIIYTIYSYAWGTNTQSPDDLKLSLSIIETALGAFIGLIVETLFGKVQHEQGKEDIAHV